MALIATIIVLNDISTATSEEMNPSAIEGLMYAFISFIFSSFNFQSR